jgi:phage-related protein
MSHLTYLHTRGREEKPLAWLHGEIKTPPFSRAARLETVFLLRRLQQGEHLSMPSSRPIPSVGLRCHELRIVDQTAIWRLVYRIDADAIVILEVFQKQTQKTPRHIIELCKRRIRIYDGAG